MTCICRRVSSVLYIGSERDDWAYMCENYFPAGLFAVDDINLMSATNDVKIALQP